MLAPMSWNSRIWHDLPDIELPEEGRGSAIYQAAKEVIQHVPTSLIYASPRVMLQDTINTLRTIANDQHQQRLTA